MSARVVIVGAGHAGISTALELREAGFTGPVVVLDQAGHDPYERPPLSKAWLAGAVSTGELAFRAREVYARRRIELRTGVRVDAIDRGSREVVTADGTRLPYDHLVLATGARPRALPVPGAGLAGVHRLHTLTDALALRAALDTARALAIVGGGFIGLEVAAAARKRGVPTTVVEAAPRLMRRVVSEPVSAFYHRLHEDAGCVVRTEAVVAELTGEDGHVTGVRLAGGATVPADMVVAGIGVTPETGLAGAAGLATGDGVLVDEALRTSDPAVFAVGDCARFPLGDAMERLESVQNAADQGRAVAAAVTGDARPYRDVPWFWTDQHGCKLQIAGIATGADEWAVVGSVQERRFTVLCWRRGALVAGESVNRPADHLALRRLIAAKASISPAAARADGFTLKDHARALAG
ncbi:pyridine nucleotide-disulfide oxidoreductase [Sphaerisporangium siamense]|uniref:3-phenylpropionate/trans-cinnamate dioxygenase ferredoxin reductase subunit n=1 Tax=Sphaerisporangium siamense TaxID=795645 RepID=A0A7W7GC26_9ACTN|nr:FAD-dependent oxidoreductase [Sphaerisporangium siamense]MBB4703450.1 3-phenylpropionate/trans-cinnamate dioxygenase ferredoxin reductase subunit [Sphaerisporangium siamense]GII87556.1 pyridine nucleotide-disulfide oxidoreductase [Sphaerisporangium siamense]